MNIGLIGSSVLCRKGRVAAYDIPDVEAISLVYESISEAPALAEAHQGEVDMLFFLGIAPYLLSLSKLRRKVPWFSVGLPTSGLHAALLEARGHLNGRVRFSIDSISEKEVYEAMSEINVEVQAIYTCPFKFSSVYEQELISFHSSCYGEGKVDFCLSCLGSAKDILAEQNIPSYQIMPTICSMREALTRSVVQVKMPDSEVARTAVGLHVIKNFSELSEERINEIYDFIAYHSIKKNIFFTKKTPALFQSIESYAQFMCWNNEFKYSPFLDALRKAFPEINICSGYGLASLISTAEEWAYRSLEKLENSAPFACCMFDGQSYRTIGDVASPISLSEELRLIAAELNITDVTLLRYLYALQLIESPFSAKEFAHALGIQPQASRKIFSMLMDKNIIQIVGKRPAASKGRPEVLYCLTERVSDVLPALPGKGSGVRPGIQG